MRRSQSETLTDSWQPGLRLELKCKQTRNKTGGSEKERASSLDFSVDVPFLVLLSEGRTSEKIETIVLTGFPSGSLLFFQRNS